MADPVSTYLTVLLVGIVLTFVVGQILVHSGRAILEEVFPRRETATSVTRLVVVLFHLVVLGVVALVVTIDFTLATAIQTIVVKLGLVLLVLGAAYAGTLSLLARLRTRRRMQLLVDQNKAQAQQYHQDPSAAGVDTVVEPAPHTGSGSDPSPGGPRL